MNTVLKLTAIVMNIGLLSVAITNFLITPIWMTAMVLFSASIIFIIAIDIIESLKKVKAFTMMELIAVITIMAILLTMTVSIMRTDTEALEAKQVGSTIKLYHSKAFSLQKDKYYNVSLKTGEFKVSDQDGVILEEIELKSEITFKDGSSVKSFNILNNGECQIITGTELQEFIFKLGGQEGKVNVFTGKFSYYLSSNEKL